MDDESGKYLNNILNNSNSSPELIEYYDVDEVSPAPDAIYPDPESVFNQNRNGINGKSLIATKFNKLQELSSPMDEDLSAKTEDAGGNDNKEHRTGNEAAISSIDFDGRSEVHETVESGTFNGKSIDFNIRHTIAGIKRHFISKSNSNIPSCVFLLAQLLNRTMLHLNSWKFTIPRWIAGIHLFLVFLLICLELKNEDLRDHDIIDNIMYIYYGSNVTLRKSLGGSIIIAGTVFALAAQILAIVFTLLRNR